MKKLIPVLGLCAIIFAACGSSEDKKEANAASDTTLLSEAKATKVTDPITEKMTLLGEAKLGQPINIKFSVYNNTDTVAKFCKWHTPFERLMSKYLDVAMEDHVDVNYTGAMAKRIMPPPADSYIMLKKGDSTSTNFNLNDGYAITKAGSYTIKYNATTISGIVVTDSLKITVSK
ncbi:protease [Pedobacter jejuensis]|uniref:Protease n=1 Tax=Pedobacter jejuensis TaxID=1268550 RepID=A0A3N0C227_9SPHI|nr:protease [Pedobacter jejuensis]RNL56441.1 protease [Pedobacter jejuensis]